MSLFPLKPTSAHVKKYYEALAVSHKHGHTTEGNTRFAFEELLRRCVSPYGWHVVPEYAFKGTDKQPLRADGALVDDLPSSTASGKPKTPTTTSPRKSASNSRRAIRSPTYSSNPRPRRPLSGRSRPRDSHTNSSHKIRLSNHFNRRPIPLQLRKP